ncbi:hypothetical protein MY1884_008467 [Beauveria asiatica]
MHVEAPRPANRPFLQCRIQRREGIKHNLSPHGAKQSTSLCTSASASATLRYMSKPSIMTSVGRSAQSSSSHSVVVTSASTILYAYLPHPPSTAGGSGKTTAQRAGVQAAREVQYGNGTLPVPCQKGGSDVIDGAGAHAQQSDGDWEPGRGAQSRAEVVEHGDGTAVRKEGARVEKVLVLGAKRDEERLLRAGEDNST